jgi:hypothetical protein
VLAGLSETTDIVMAMDLEGAFGVPRIRKWIDANDIKEIKPEQLDQVARTLATMKGITLTVNADQDVAGRAVVEFDGDVADLRACAKPVMIEVLNTAGMRLDDIQQWTFTAADKQVSMEGKLSASALRKLLSIVQSPIPAATVVKQPSADSRTTPADPLQASQRYYKTISSMLDNFTPGTSASESASFARNMSKRIDQLPILNVDPQLVQWGSRVSLKLKEAGAGMAVAQTQMNSRVAGVMDPTYGAYYYDDSGVYHTRTSDDNAARQRRQAALEQKAQAQEKAFRMLKEIAETRPVIRAAMVEKYKAEF